LIEKPWLDRLLDPVPPGARVLDLGCGAGEPIGALIASKGLRLTGFDSAGEMLAIARGRLPQAHWIEGDMRDLALTERFHAIVGWDSVFHLRPDEQRALLPKLAAHLVPGGGLLLTVGPREGEPIGSVAGEAVYHASLSPQEYSRRLSDCGMEIVAFVPEDPSCGGRTILLACRANCVAPPTPDPSPPGGTERFVPDAGRPPPPCGERHKVGGTSMSGTD
jgi:SAM-dependent methyltransferase